VRMSTAEDDDSPGRRRLWRTVFSSGSTALAPEPFTDVNRER